MKKIVMSQLTKTWLIDIDGVIFIHNSHLTSRGDQLVDGAIELFEQILPTDIIILLTSRRVKYKELTIESLNKFHIRFNQIIFDLPPGERIIINDMKKSGLNTAIGLNTQRDKLGSISIVRDPQL